MRKLLCALGIFISQSILASALMPPPKLVIVLVYDQFRADYLTRFQNEFLPAQQKNGKLGGFRYLMEKGAYYPFAQYEVMQSMTCPGHAMILSGSYPYSNGISLNEWFDRKTNQLTYCVADKDFGVSPRRFKGSTVGDELKLKSSNARVVSVSIKDRAAVMLGGHAADIVLWLNEKSMIWETSKFYAGRSNLSWLEPINKDVQALKEKEIQWKPHFIKSSFSHSEKGSEALGFPLGVELTQKIALELVRKYKLGQGPSTDILAVSFSSHDISGHEFGPNSDEMHELTLHEDFLLSDFLNNLKKQVPGGLSQSIIVLTADHGVAPLATDAAKHGLDSGTIDQKRLLENLNHALAAQFGKPKGEKWVSAFQYFNFYFDPANSEKLEPIRNEVLQFSKKWFLAQNGVAFVLTSADYANKNFPPEIQSRQMAKTYVPEVNGDLMIVPKPFWYELLKEDSATHITGYSYDRSVPLLISGPGIRAGVYSQTAHVVDLAPTLSFLLGQLSPALSEGRVLSEIFQPR